MSFRTPNLFNFGLLSSKMHIVWVKAVCGQLETRVRFSAAIGYSSFPVPSISDLKKREIAACALEVLAIRENYSEKSLADLYDPDDMPADLAEAHQKLDRTVDDCYSKAAMQSDEDRLNCLFKLYEKMTRS
ncbi:type IIL restriction-modification enzyme MmeI [Massilia sp. WF1]|uniref:type IIL restriction-modification enzyme MmeI n=1 Tax=Massilia sp. WF1 TaxID=1406431 RepID=UPI0018D237B6|nr:type IIL restriction-modification enzyme MmeI [Massilia sp. WF1]